MESKSTKRLLRIPEVLDRVALSRSTWLRAVKAGTAPAPLKISAGVSVWAEAQIDSWIDSRVEEALNRQAIAPEAQSAQPLPARRRGRPRKDAALLNRAE